MPKVQVSTMNDEKRKIYYQLSDGQNSIGTVDRIELSNNEFRSRDVGNLRDAILQREQLTCRPGDLSLYAKGTTIDDYPNQLPLRISLSLSDDQIQETTEGNPLLVVLSPVALPAGTANTQQANAISNTPDWQDLLAFVRTKKAEEETLIISEPKTKLFKSVLDELNLKMDAARWCDKPKFDPPGAPYTWRSSKEDSQENRAAYMAYLRNPDNIIWPQETQLFEGSLDKDLLTVKVLGFDSIKTSGNIDVVLASSHHQSIATVRQNILMGIELKKDTNRDSSKIERQVTLQHIAASYLNADTGVLTMMTDLHDRWIFFWFAEGNRLIRYEATRPEAMFLIRHSQDDDDERQAIFPTSFLDRACWNDLFSPQLDSIVEVKSFDEKEGEGTHPQQGSGGGGGGKSLVEAGDQSVSQQVTSHGTGSASRHHGKSHRYNCNGKKHVQIGDASLEYMDEEERFEAIVRTAFHKMLHIPKVEEQQDEDILPREIVWGDSKTA